MKIERVQRGIASTIHVTLTQDGVAADPEPDDATVTLTRWSTGAQIGPYDAYDEGTGAFSHTLTPTDAATLDTFTAAWTVTYDGTAQTLETRVEVVGGFLFSLADARATSGLNATNNDSSYRITTAQILEARTDVERRLEQELGFAMVPRYSTHTFTGSGSVQVMLPHAYPRRIRAATINGTALTDAQLATLTITPTGILYYPGGWTAGSMNITVGYEHGLDTPPPGAKQVALALAKRQLTGSPADDRAQTMSTDEQVTTFYVPTSTEPFDVPAANRFIAANSLRVGIA